MSNTDGTRNVKRTAKTRLNKDFRAPWTVNSRHGIDGEPLVVSQVYVAKGGEGNKQSVRCITKYLDRNTENGGTVTPFNIIPTCEAACGITKIVKDGDTTTVIFVDGDRVVLTLHKGESYDLHTAVLWALGKKVFGEDLSRQIGRAIDKRLVDVKALHEQKVTTYPADPCNPPACDVCEAGQTAHA